MMVRQNYTAVIERNRLFEGRWTSEPYECGWASEALFFIRKLETSGSVEGKTVKVQVSPDGMRWCDEGSTIKLSDEEVDYCKVHRFGNWLRLSGSLPQGASMRVIITLALKE